MRPTNDFRRVYAPLMRGILPRLFSVAPQRDSYEPQASSGKLKLKLSAYCFNLPLEARSL